MQNEIACFHKQLGALKLILFRMLGLVVLAGLMTSCTSAPEVGTSDWLVGTWSVTASNAGDTRITFNSDGTGLMQSNGVQDTIDSWSLSGTTVTVSNDKGTQKMAISEMMPNSFVSTTTGSVITFNRVTS